MASEPWTRQPGGKIVRWRNKDCESHPWNKPKWWRSMHHQRYRHEINQLLREGRWLEAEKPRPRPWYW